MPNREWVSQQFVYLTTIGRKTGASREIEIWFIEREGRLYILAEHGYKAHWVQNLLANSSATLRFGETKWEATARILDPARDDELFADVRQLARQKYGWGDGLPVEFRLECEIED
jgi:deazaflavin-dependent oxidoreductase (nitroreductase family)